MSKGPLHLATPARMAAALVLIVAIAQIAVMVVLHKTFDIDRQSWWVESMLSTVALTLLLSLFVVFGLIRPLQAALRREREKVRIVLDNASEGIVTIDEYGTIQAFNRAAETLFGYAAAEVVGRNISLIVPSPDKERHDAYMRRYRATGHGRVVNTRRQVRVQRRDGLVFPVEMSMSKVELPGEQLFTAIIHDITERLQMEQRVHRLAYHDALTGLPNRALYFDRLAHSLALAQREKLQVGLLMLDLDGFKQINDRLGHEAGDRVLQEVAKRLQPLVRDSDTVARLGGDEFVIILSSIADRAAAEDVARRACTIIDQPFVLPATSVSLGVSVGVAVYPADGLTADELARVADARMYDSKERGKAAQTP